MTRAETIATGLYFGEGPRWHEGRLWFSDFYAHAIRSVGTGGDLRTELEVDGQPSGLGWMPDGTLLFVSMLDRKLKRVREGRVEDHADLSAVATFHCNDMVVDASGRAYVGNFGFDLEAEMGARGAQGVIAGHATASMARVDPDGAVSVAATDLSFPNGTVITPGGRTLIVAETLGLRLTAFDIAADGELSNRRTWADLAPRLPDGICLDAAGHVWFANPLAPEAVCVAEGGEVVAAVETSAPTFACMLGGDDGRTLFALTASGSGSEAANTPTGKVEVARVEVPHAGLP
jgi:sugar lactone lactonase YvrE